MAINRPLSAALLLLPITAGAQDIDTSLLNGIHLPDGSLGEIIVALLQNIIRLVGIVAVFMVVIVGLRLMVGIGSTLSREVAVKMLLYITAGIIVIALADTIVRFIALALYS